jgi:hypothetical protein
MGGHHVTTLDKILEITETVEQFVERGAWAEASVLDQERRRLLMELLNDSTGEARRHHEEALRNLLERTNRMLTRAHEMRSTTLAAASQELNSNPEAIKAYGKNIADDNLVYFRRAVGNAR